MWLAHKFLAPSLDSSNCVTAEAACFRIYALQGASLLNLRQNKAWPSQQEKGRGKSHRTGLGEDPGGADVPWSWEREAWPVFSRTLELLAHTLATDEFTSVPLSSFSTVTGGNSAGTSPSVHSHPE